ncbi:alpha/beta fold hydrolase [Chelatococcus reniformis]|uniref:Alpha/beta hydrolase n=1 Tax=Chelatococcus reniformis TaxID=1494448 RepID=A0A916UEA3_9HYPH|nr:alpha/beta hydrolase [Chelatococcus reniformis]GGC69837.1 alpha/beta hydrolase [Chelatococcus reniformis]
MSFRSKVRSGLAATVAALALVGPLVAAGSAAADPVKTIVMVHGAFADGSSWHKVIPLLQAKGYTVVAVQSPLSSLGADVAATDRAIALQTGPVLLVGHSWGGTVITEAGTDDKVAGLVYVAAMANDAGQSFIDRTKGYPKPPGVESLRTDSSGFVSLTPEGFARDFAPDLPAAEAAELAAVQGPIFGKCFEERVTNAAWKSKPSWYIVAKNDRMLDPGLQAFLAKEIKARTTELESSHVPMLSEPEKVAAVIAQAAEEAGAALGAKQPDQAKQQQ